ncbi:MAG: M28 family peptidase [Clostridia bacterium]|nr:M28 family peptidase [Clostridia bacterium]
MTRLQEITNRYPIRKTKEQKDAFLKYAVTEARGMGYTARVERNGGHRNFVAGDPERANVIFTAHYDTSANRLLPNPMIPRNIPLFLLCQLGIVALLFVVSFCAGWLSFVLTRESGLTLVVFLLAYYALLMLMILGPANKNNANSNTSGVAAVMQLMAQLPVEIRDQAAFLLFDNGEKGKAGSRAYAGRHPEIKKQTVVFNMDCVGVGEHLLIICKNYARATYAYPLLTESFKARDGITPHFYPSSGSAVNSDHQSFRRGFCAGCCKRRRGVGFYTPDIHTGRDTRASQGNIDYLTGSLVTFVKSVAAG